MTVRKAQCAGMKTHVYPECALAAAGRGAAAPPTSVHTSSANSQEEFVSGPCRIPDGIQKRFRKDSERNVTGSCRNRDGFLLKTCHLRRSAQGSNTQRQTMISRQH